MDVTGWMGRMAAMVSRSSARPGPTASGARRGSPVHRVYRVHREPTAKSPDHPEPTVKSLDPREHPVLQVKSLAPRAIRDLPARQGRPGPACPPGYHLEEVEVHQRAPIDRDLPITVCQAD